MAAAIAPRNLEVKLLFHCRLQLFFSPTFLLPVLWNVTDEVRLQVSVRSVRVAVVGAEIKFGGQERAGTATGASEDEEKQRGKGNDERH